MLSRGVAGVAGRTLVVNLPGSPGGVRDGLGVLEPVLDHAVDQIGEGTTSECSRVGGSERVVLRAAVGEEPLDVSEHAALVDGPRSGAVVTFSGRGARPRPRPFGAAPWTTRATRARARSSSVSPPRSRRATRRHRGGRVHRVGSLAIGDVALACAVAAEHRREAFDACSELVDEVKRQLPVWKRQEFADGSEEWVNCP